MNYFMRKKRQTNGCVFLETGNNQNQNSGYNQGYNNGPMGGGNFGSGGGGNRRY